jgi:hypothetical protein
MAASEITPTNKWNGKSQLPDHKIHFLYPVKIIPAIETKCKSIELCEKRINKSIVSTLSTRFKQKGFINASMMNCEKSWKSLEYKPEQSDSGNEEDNKYFLPGAGFLPHFAAIAAGRRHQGAFLSRHWEINSVLLELLNATWNKVVLTKPALKRMSLNSDPSPIIEFRIDGVFITAFATGTAILNLVIKYRVADAALESVKHVQPEQFIVEANYALCHRKQSYASQVAVIAEIFLEDMGFLAQELYARRTFVFTGIAFKANHDDIRNLACQLALKENSDYQWHDELAQAFQTWHPNNGVIHTVSPEGGSIVLCNVERSNFLTKYLSRNFNAYLALARLALHENIVLSQYSGRLAAIGHLSVLRYGDYSMLSDIRRCIYQYRLNFRFTSISDELRNNHVHHMWRTVFHLDKQEHELDADARHIDFYVAANRFAAWSIFFKIVGGLATVFGGFVTLDKVLDLGQGHKIVTMTRQLILDTTAQGHPLLIILPIMAIAMWLAYFIFKPGRRPSCQSPISYSKASPISPISNCAKVTSLCCIYPNSKFKDIIINFFKRA